MRKPYIVALVVAGILSACASTHGLKPEASVQSANSLKATTTLSSASVDANSWPDSDWWTQFHDPQLNQLIAEGLAGSPTLRVAEARTRAALAQAQVAQSARLPQADGKGDVTRERFPERSLVPPPYGGSWDTLSELQATLSWEIDFWGKNRAAYSQALGQARAAELDARAARLALSANIAHAYVQLERAYLQLDVANATLQQREQIFKLTQDRNVAGVDSKLELRQAQSALPARSEEH